MYEKPQIIHIGKANAMILGLSSFGSDPDGSDFPMEFEFADGPNCEFD